MTEKTYIRVSGVIFLVVALLHLLRLLLKWDAVIGGWTVPTWFSGVGVFVAGWLAYSAFRFRAR